LALAQVQFELAKYLEARETLALLLRSPVLPNALKSQARRLLAEVEGALGNRNRAKVERARAAQE
jgi:hypothetical protein